MDPKARLRFVLEEFGRVSGTSMSCKVGYHWNRFRARAARACAPTGWRTGGRSGISTHLPGPWPAVQRDRGVRAVAREDVRRGVRRRRCRGRARTRAGAPLAAVVVLLGCVVVAALPPTLPPLAPPPQPPPSYTIDTWRQALSDAQMGAALRAAEVLEFDEAAGGGGEGRGEGR